MEDLPEEIIFNILAYSNNINNMLFVNKRITDMYKCIKIRNIIDQFIWRI